MIEAGAFILLLAVCIAFVHMVITFGERIANAVIRQIEAKEKFDSEIAELLKRQRKKNPIEWTYIPLDRDLKPGETLTIKIVTKEGGKDDAPQS